MTDWAGIGTVSSPPVTVRAGMTDLIGQIRAFCNLGTNDYTLGTATYWSDEHIQTALDRYRLAVVEEELSEISNTIASGSVEYKEFHSRYGNYEQTTGGSSIFTIEDSTGTIIGTSNYVVDYANGIITFTENQSGSARFLTGRSYDIYGAAADIWKTKAGAYAGAVDFKTDNMSVNRSQMFKQAMSAAREYEAMAKPRVMNLIRDDSV